MQSYNQSHKFWCIYFCLSTLISVKKMKKKMKKMIVSLFYVVLNLLGLSVLEKGWKFSDQLKELFEPFGVYLDTERGMMNNTREQAIADLKRIIIAVKATDLESLMNKNSIKLKAGTLQM